MSESSSTIHKVAGASLEHSAKQNGLKGEVQDVPSKFVPDKFVEPLGLRHIKLNQFTQQDDNTVLLNKLAGGEGVEPPRTESESAVLPLDEPPTT